MSVPPGPASALAAQLTSFCCAQLDALAARHLPGFGLPRTYGGHAVGADVRADLLFTLGHLADAGVSSVGGRAVDDVIVEHLGLVDGRATHTFFSYRVAETVARDGAFAGNPLLAQLSDAQRDQVASACDSTEWIALLDQGALPRNYAAVLARCERARARLGLTDDEGVPGGLVDRMRAVLSENPNRYLDDSNDGAGRYDIYTIDVWLFCEPFADVLGPLWREGIAASLGLVDAVGARDGSAVPWGRSTGVLAVAHTIELAVVALTGGFVSGREPVWWRRALDATAAMPGWYTDGVVNAHQYRDQDRYRGPARRLQLTLDVLGKLAWCASRLRAAGGGDSAIASVPDAYPAVDRLLTFSPRDGAAVWAYRDRAHAFAFPLVGGSRSHYLPAPYAPACFELPVDADLACWTPLVLARGRRYAGGGVPDTVTVLEGGGGVTATWHDYVPIAEGIDTAGAPPLPGARELSVRIDRRSLMIDETLHFERTPDSVSVLVPEIERRPLSVEFVSEHEHLATTVDVRGLAEWRSSWSEIVRTHQLDLTPASELRYSIRVTPKLRVASTAFGHHYHRSLYDPLEDRVVTMPSPFGPLASADDAARLGDVDVFHLHWPEWLAFDDIAAHDAIIATLQDRGIPIVWTAHNLTPHEKRPEVYDSIYRRWLAAADAVVHHSAWGGAKFRARYPDPPESHTRHVVIPHGHFGGLRASTQDLTKTDGEARLGFEPCALRIGIVGAPRAEKLVDTFVRAFIACGRDDLQLAVWSFAFGDARPGHELPADPRVVAAERYREVSAHEYGVRLAACDVLALPFDPDGDMLATGTAADALGLGLPALRSDWAYLVETLGDAGIPCGHTLDSMMKCLDGLTPEQVESARAASEARRNQYAWPALADHTFTLLESTLLT